MVLINTLATILGFLCTLYGLFFAAIAIIGGIKRVKLHPYAAPKNRICAVIAARNEEKVIGYLVKSLLQQNYPRELFDIVVLPNNCSDDTAGAARRAGATVMNCTIPVKSKGEVLRYAFSKLTETGKYDAYCVFDADNIVDSNYFTVVNNTLCSGAKIAQGYRDSKNPDDSWVAGCVAMFYWMMSRFYNRSRNALGVSAALNGTGFMISDELIRKQGWETHSLTEDLEYTAQCAINDVKIDWMDDAIAYDEQPIRLWDSYIQRRRWSAGTVQCLQLYCKPLMNGIVKKHSFQCADIAAIFLGAIVQLISIIPVALTVLSVVLAFMNHPGEWKFALLGLAAGGVSGYLFSTLLGFLICLLEKKLSKKRIGAILGFGFFLITWIPANLVSIFTKPPKWKEIPHTCAVGIEHVTNTDKEQE